MVSVKFPPDRRPHSGTFPAQVRFICHRLFAKASALVKKFLLFCGTSPAHISAVVTPGEGRLPPSRLRPKTVHCLSWPRGTCARTRGQSSGNAESSSMRRRWHFFESPLAGSSTFFCASPPRARPASARCGARCQKSFTTRATGHRSAGHIAVLADKGAALTLKRHNARSFPWQRRRVSHPDSPRARGQGAASSPPCPCPASRCPSGHSSCSR